MSRDAVAPHWAVWCVAAYALSAFLQFYCLGNLLWVYTVLPEAEVPSEGVLAATLHHSQHDVARSTSCPPGGDPAPPEDKEDDEGDLPPEDDPADETEAPPVGEVLRAVLDSAAAAQLPGSLRRQLRRLVLDEADCAVSWPGACPQQIPTPAHRCQQQIPTPAHRLCGRSAAPTDVLSRAATLHRLRHRPSWRPDARSRGGSWRSAGMGGRSRVGSWVPDRKACQHGGEDGGAPGVEAGLDATLAQLLLSAAGHDAAPASAANRDNSPLRPLLQPNNTTEPAATSTNRPRRNEVGDPWSPDSPVYTVLAR